MKKRTPNSIRNEIAKLVEEYSSIVYADKAFEGGCDQIPAAGKVIDAAELKNMVEASLDGWLTTGRFNDAFEQRLAEFLQVKHLITVNSGSSANLIAFNTLTSSKLGDRAIKPGDEVIGVAAGFPTTVNPILQFGAIPVLVDVELGSYNVDVKRLKEAIGPRTKAIMLAHTLGNPFNLEAVTSICKEHNIWLIEDCCDALGSTYNGKMVGSFGDIGTLSFYPAHHITMGEGGAVFTNSAKLKKIAESFRDWGRDCYCPPGKDNTCNNRFCWTAKKLGGSLPDGYDHKYIYSHAGYNLKITDMQAACGLAQLDKVDGFIAKRRANFVYLKEALSKFEKYLILPEATENSDPSWFGFPITIKPDSNISRIHFIEHLNKCNIGTRLMFAGNLTRQPYMKDKRYRLSGDLQNTDIVMNNTLWIGVYPGINVHMLDYVIDTIRMFFESHC